VESVSGVEAIVPDVLDFAFVVGGTVAEVLDCASAADEIVPDVVGFDPAALNIAPAVGEHVSAGAAFEAAGMDFPPEVLERVLVRRCDAIGDFAFRLREDSALVVP
jgi:hypothetical protein